MNDIKFLEKYNEAALDNFLAVVKQNILFQAQVAYLSETNNQVPDLKKQIADFEKVKDAHVRLQEDNANLKNELNSKITIIESANKSDAEKYRLQTAVNNQMRDNEILKNASVSLQQKVNELTEQVAKLEEMLPKSAKKKLNLLNAGETNQEEKVDNDVKQTLSSGGHF